MLIVTLIKYNLFFFFCTLSLVKVTAKRLCSIVVTCCMYFISCTKTFSLLLNIFFHLMIQTIKHLLEWLDIIVLSWSMVIYDTLFVWVCSRVYVENRLAATKINHDSLKQLMGECRIHISTFFDMVRILQSVLAPNKSMNKDVEVLNKILEDSVIRQVHEKVCISVFLFVCSILRESLIFFNCDLEQKLLVRYEWLLSSFIS